MRGYLWSLFSEVSASYCAGSPCAFLDQRPSTFLLECADMASGPWRNATSDDTLSYFPDAVTHPAVTNLTIVPDCHARHWRLNILDTFGTLTQSPAAIVKAIHFLGAPTGSPTTAAARAAARAGRADLGAGLRCHGGGAAALRRARAAQHQPRGLDEP